MFAVGRVSFEPRTIVDGQVVIAFVEDVVITIILVETWTNTFAERLYAESTALTNANPHTIVRLKGGEPGASVRKRVAELQADLEAQIPNASRRVAVLTDSVLVRGAMTALRWITGDQMSGFATNDVHGAASWVAGDMGDDQRITRMVHKCESYVSDEGARPSRFS